MRKLLAPVAVLALVLFAFASVASGHTGSVSASEDCQWFHVSVVLNNNVSIDRTVDVTTTIPGTTGITGGHYDTTGETGDTEILHLMGPAPASGTVTLTISGGSGEVFTDSASITPADDCQPPSQQESVAESVTESVAQSVAESVTESVGQSAAESVCEQTEQGGFTCPSAEQSVEAGTGTPAGSIPNTSLDGSGPNPLSTILFSLVLLASLGTLAYTNVKVVARRNR